MKDIILPGQPGFDLVQRISADDPRNIEVHARDTQWIRDALSDAHATQFSAILGTTYTTSTLRKEDIYKSILELKKAMEQTAPEPSVSGWTDMKIHTSIHAEKKTNKPKKVHVRRWYHTKKYHLKKQQQFNAEYGFVAEPCIYFVNPRATANHNLKFLDYADPYLVVHPKLYKTVCQIIYNQDFETLESLVNRFVH
jgi:hypothetical protein